MGTSRTDAMVYYHKALDAFLLKIISVSARRADAMRDLTVSSFISKTYAISA